MEYFYNHFGVPIREKRENMIYYPEYQVWASDYEKDPYQIEWLFFEENTVLHPLIQTIPHVCFLVKDVQKAVHNKKMLLEPTYYHGFYIAFILDNNVPIEFIQPMGEEHYKPGINY